MDVRSIDQCEHVWTETAEKTRDGLTVVRCIVCGKTVR